MISKRIRAGFWNNDRPAASLLHIYANKGFDKDQLQKIASAISLTFEDIKPEKGSSFVHLITTGSGEFYGPNSNADWFNESNRSFTFSEGLFKSAQLQGGLTGFHKTYREFGGVYRNHNNSKKGFDKEGEVVWEGYNEPMHRGELVVKLKDDLWHDDLEKLASGEPVFWSQGCGVPEDICSICGNRAKTRQNYCEHLKYAKLEMDKEGHQVFAINDRPHFHDISRVTVPADKIAFTLGKIASEGVDETIMFETDDSGMYLPLSLINKLASRKEASRAELIYKLAKIEKEVDLKPEGMFKDLAEAFDLPEGTEDEIVGKLKDIPENKLFSSLSNNNSMLTPNSFIRIVVKREPEDFPGLPKELESIFSNLKDNGDLNELMEDGSYSSCGRADRKSEESVKGLSDSISLDPEPVEHRIIKISITGGKQKEMDKESASYEPTSATRYIAKEYAKYQLSFLANSGKEENLKYAVLQNRVG